MFDRSLFWKTPPSRRPGPGAGLGGRRAGGQDERERGALAQAALGAEAAVVRLDDIAADGQSQSRPAGA